MLTWELCYIQNAQTIKMSVNVKFVIFLFVTGLMCHNKKYLSQNCLVLFVTGALKRRRLKTASAESHLPSCNMHHN